MIRHYWRKLSNHGENMLMSPEEHRQNRILNHGFVYAVGLYLTTYFVALVFFYFLTRLDFARYTAYFWPYTAACLITAIGTAGLLYLRGKPGFSTIATVATYCMSLGHNLAMLLFMGLGGGFQFFLAALIPAAYLAHPHRRLIYIPLYLTTFMALGGGVLWSLTHKPWYPVPEPFTSITFYTLLGTSSIFFIACFAYVAYKYDWWRRLMVYWEALSVYGLKWSDSDEERTHHIITNQTMVLHGIFPPVIILVSLALSLVLWWQGVSGWWKHLLAFSTAAVASGILWYIIFIVAAKFWRAGFLFLFLIVDLSLVSFLVLLTGDRFGIHYFYFPLITLPIYFFPGRRRLFTAEIITIACAICGVVYSPSIKPLLNLPTWMVRSVYLIVVTLIAGSITVGFVYIWWQRRITRRLYLLWEWLSMLGIPETLPSSEKKKQILLNRVYFLMVIYNYILAPSAIGVVACFAFFRGESNISSTLLWISLAYLPMLPLGLMALYWRLRRPQLLLKGGWAYNWIVPIFILAISFQFFLLCIQIQSTFELQLFFLTILTSVFAFLPEFRLRMPVLVAFGGVLILASISLYYQANYPALNPVWSWAESSTRIAVWIVVSFTVVFMTFYVRHESDKSESALEVAHQKSESLLLNILPRDVADELKDKGHSAPVRIESVTVMFTDFAGFTKISESLTPEQVVDELDKCFSYFDQIMEKYNLEKLKTIGDSYMCAGGIPKPNHTHAIDCCLAAMEIQSFMNQMKEIKALQGLPYWELRLGIHTGPLVAGVVGHKKFAYDVWGDTVNTASRMESSGTTGKINISSATYEQVKFLFDCTHRGQIAAKNKGMIEMYYLNGIRAKYSAGGDGRGRVPNSRFKEIYQALARGAKLVERAN